MEPSMLCNTKGPERQTAASEVLELAGDIERMAEDVANRTMCRLQTVMDNELPEKACEATVKPMRPYPELFDLLRGRLNGIKAALVLINSGLDRLEL
jgi:hypothetical protein